MKYILIFICLANLNLFAHDDHSHESETYLNSISAEIDSRENKVFDLANSELLERLPVEFSELTQNTYAGNVKAMYDDILSQSINDVKAHLYDTQDCMGRLGMSYVDCLKKSPEPNSIATSHNLISDVESILQSSNNQDVVKQFSELKALKKRASDVPKSLQRRANN